MVTLPTSDSPRVELCFDSHEEGKQHEGQRVVAVSIQPALPEALARLMTAEGLWHDGGVWAGPRERFWSALLRMPAQYAPVQEALRQCLAFGPVPARGVMPSKTLVMGILNVTPDSFYDGGRYTRVEQALARARQMVADGVDIIDVGGESARPGADPVPLEEERRRVLPVVRAIVEELGVTVSIDTYKSEVAKAALDAGAVMVNDISGLTYDSDMAHVVADKGAQLIVMHVKGTPRNMQQNPVYDDVVLEVRDALARSCEQALAAGVAPEGLWIDPGIGFGKSVEHNLTLLAQLRALRTLGFPIMVGTSNKSMIGQVLGVGVDERSEGTAATVAVAIANGADGVRVHDVRAMGRVCAMTDAIVRGEKG